MAAALFQDHAARFPGGQPWRVESAGIWARDGQPASSGALAAMNARGLNLSRHRSRIVTPDILESFSLILTMEKSQQEALQVEFPQISGRVFLLSEVAGSHGDIRDPYGSSQEAYETTAAELSNLIANGFGKISELAQP
jgi:protein-tyrosine phosphatase